MVNGITFYRLLTAPLLLTLLFYERLSIFKWLLIVSFLTDAVDGHLARKFKVTSAFGSILDSVSDDLTIAVAIIGIVLVNPAFLKQELVLVVIQVFLFFAQIAAALFRYRKISSFHTYLAKFVAVFQAVFLMLFYWLPQPVYILFYFVSALTILDLLEEIVLVLIIPKWETDIKGLYWVIKKSALPKV
ncbi:CDP-alcohol phosphatidyltransferase family protein [Mucilaginibacter rubeus]|uniref:CDP-alcohol phosphatidyltransferase family protein n=1 Tax=Mucilaginibacter rubeus TaxID=2027860 RepID=A0ABX7ULG9_9SPHI|nr:CDP-alcohol phosphatidyltransferase family protein [Mucilaginibacter rubeus]QTE53676.1 CDP-alcohol phosphatidyltransferase family protein [Mucilaginibacter rubeus]QTE60176.1 CDP-alcohol phosphatidyltransferase family protein [Mucilaginibacter rubeus]QTE66892.1 CDP-alcohol phosphatidyltransferase family protein [Mucilaginibacter rubeus]QTF65705.1 CDP-alcohol phosphatidyltransferase family protein [Mucilaginibacter rubeus]